MEAPHDAADLYAEARAQLEEARTQEASGLVDMGDGHFYLGWHPLFEYFTVRRRAEGAPETLPMFLASLEEAPHVHAGGETPKEALDQLLALYQRAADHLTEQERHDGGA